MSARVEADARRVARTHVERLLLRPALIAPCKRIADESDKRVLRGIGDDELIAKVKRATAADEQRRAKERGAWPLLGAHCAKRRVVVVVEFV